MSTAIILLGIGLLSILLEFFLPGGVLGGIGALFLLASIFFFITASESLILSLFYVIGVFALLGLLIKFALWKLQRSTSSGSFYSKVDEEGYTASTWEQSLVGKNALVITDLRPGGHIVIDNKRYSAISQSGYLVKGTPVTVIGGEGDTLIVKQQIKGQ